MMIHVRDLAIQTGRLERCNLKRDEYAGQWIQHGCEKLSPSCVDTQRAMAIYVRNLAIRTGRLQRCNLNWDENGRQWM
jgi:hypothetical protein